jgi:hypothetical protein
MTTNSPVQGSVIVYPYLWTRQRDAGETEGRKARPACVVLRLRDSHQAIHHLVILAITSKPPSRDQRVVEIPDTERQRAGLTRYPRAWVVVSEYNYDTQEHSWYYEIGKAPLGAFSARFLREIATALQPAFAQTKARVDRTV